MFLPRAGLLLLAILLPLAGAWADDAGRRTLLQGAWAPDETGLLNASGIKPQTFEVFDLRLLNEIGLRAGIGLVLRPMEAAHIDAALEAGELDFALPEIKAGANLDRTALSIPYRERSDLLFVSNRVTGLPASGIDALRVALDRGLRIGVSRDRRNSPAVDALLSDPRHARQVILAPRDADNLDHLLIGRIDGFLALRLLGLSVIAAKPGAADLVVAILDPVQNHSIHIRYSKARVGPDTVEALDEAILSARADGTESALRARATAPILLRLAAAERWFHWIEILGIVAYAFSGVLLARREGYSLVGGFVLAALPSVGGGTLRDLLVARHPVGVLASATPMLLVTGTVLVSFFAFRLIERFGGWLDRPRQWMESEEPSASVLSFKNLYEVTDALGLGALTVVGVLIAVMYWAEPLWMWGPICAAITGAGGGVLRDVVRAESDQPALRTAIYVEISVLWGLILSVIVLWLGQEERPELLRLAVICVVLGGFLTRMGVVWFHARSLRF